MEEVIKQDETEAKKKKQIEGLMKKTETAWDNENYMELLKSAIIKSNSVNRTGDKPMAALSDKFDSHLSYRLVHELDAALIIKRLADGLGLNGELAYVGMLMHDVGHPFSAHDGEEIFTNIGKYYNCGYFHHNAKGVEVIRAENILNNAIQMIPDIENSPELKKSLENDFNYFLDIVISHDGEADPRDLEKRPHEYPSIEAAVEDKLEKSNTKNDYKFISQTPEGMLAKYADVIAYLSSDVRDGFRLGILKTFNERYLELFGRIIAEGEIKDKARAIEIAKSQISKIQEKHLEECIEDIKSSKNAEILETTKKIIKHIQDEKINTYMLSKYYDEDERPLEQANSEAEYEEKKEKIENRINEILQEHLEKFIEDKGEIAPEQYEEVEADIEKITRYVNEMLYINTKVVNEVTNTVQEYFVRDLIQNTKNEIKLDSKRIENGEADVKQTIPVLSDKALELYTRAKNFGYTFYVPHTKTRYQRELLPNNVKKIVEYCAREIINKGIIDRKLQNREIRSQIPQELLKYADHEQHENADNTKRDIKSFITNQTIKGRYTADKKNRRERFDIVRKVEKNIAKQTSRFAKTYVYTCKAIENQISNKVKRAVSENYELDTKKSDGIEFEIEKEIQQLRTSIFEKYPSMAKEITSDEDRNQKENLTEEIIGNLVEEERKKIVEKMAIQLSMDYVSGMTDEGIKNLAIDLGFMNEQTYNEVQSERGGEINETLRNLQKITEDNSSER